MNRLILFGILVALLASHREPAVLSAVREKYVLLRKKLATTGQFPQLQQDVILTGMQKQGPQGDVGYNVNKGHEIFLCLKGDLNSVMHVLLHELAHMTVSEYDHSSKFWENLGELKRVATGMGIYEGIGTKTFCDGEIRD
jgi:hypothetical protein